MSVLALEMSSFKLNKRLIKEYFFDWLIVAIAAPLAVYLMELPPYEQMFFLSDKTISYPYIEKQRVSEPISILFSTLVPGLIISLWCMFQNSSRSLHHGLLGLCVSNTMTLMIVSIIKAATGRLRPDWLDRCKPKLTVPADGKEIIKDLVTSVVCTQTDTYLLKEGRKSFVSFHSSMVFAGLVYMSLFLAGKIALFDRKGHTYKVCIIAAPLVLALIIAATRLQDNRHHWADVVVGSLMGSGFATFSYHHYFHSPISDRPGVPFSRRESFSRDSPSRLELRDISSSSV